jgi:peptidyl-prolyl cis-trans isomerase A (cyclophilin A)
MFHFLRLAALAAVLLSSSSSTLRAQIYAEVQVGGGVTGTFTITLEHVKAPVTVANFIGLATGQHGWLELSTGRIRHEPFYDGIIFHRVIAGFMSQVGSRAGDGTDGPGYSFRDEFDPTLRHSGPYVVSMANSGKHTNGSQIFITAAATPNLDDKHAVFGTVTAGQAVCDQINSTATTGSGGVPADRPLNPIVIRSIQIHGASLTAFDLRPAGLPKVLNAQPRLSRQGASYLLTFDALPFSALRGYHSDDLFRWTPFRASYSGAATAPGNQQDVTVLATGMTHFFRMARVAYGETAAKFVPASVGGRNFTFTSNFPFVSDVVFNAAGTGGTWTLRNSGSGAIKTATYTPGQFTSQLYMRWDSTTAYGFDLEFLYTLDHAAPNSGRLTGETNANGYSSVVGSFVSGP